MLPLRMLLGIGPGKVSALARYAMFNGQNGDGVYAIGAARSVDSGATFTEYASNPVLTHGSGWESGHVKDPWLMWDGSQYVLYYSGHNGSAYQIGRATASSHEGPWTKYASNPVLTVGAGGAFDDAGVNFPTVFYEPADTGHEWKMWYAANDGSTQTIGYAYSSNGLAWTKVGKVLDVGAGGTWDDVGVIPCGIVAAGGTYYLFYGGRSAGSAPVFWQGGLATFTNPAGTYTKSGSNPILHNGLAVGYSQGLTANTASGSAVVTVASTAQWVVGMPMLLADGDSESEYHRIASIDSGTQITLDTVTTSAFSTVNGAGIRPFDFISVVPRSVLAVAAGWQMFYTPFQPQDDLSPGGTKLREAAMRATNTALTGVWTPVQSGGLLFPLFPATTGWHKFSAENPSVIAAP